MENHTVGRKRSQTLTNSISFTHTRANVDSDDEQQQPQQLQHQRSTLNFHRSKTTTSTNNNPFSYLNRNNSSSTIHSITHTLSNVSFNPIQPPTVHTPTESAIAGGSANTTPTNSSPLSPMTSSSKNAFLKAKQYAKTKTLKRMGKSSTDHYNLPSSTSVASTTVSNANSSIQKQSSSHNFLKLHHQSHAVSSSASNSKYEAGTTLYSFDPSNNSNDVEFNDGILKHVLNDTNLKYMGFEDRDALADNLWNMIKSTVAPLFKVTTDPKVKYLNLKMPIEDINKLFQVFLKLRIDNNYSAFSIINEIQDFFKKSFNILENELNFNDLISDSSNINLTTFYRISITWNYFFKKIYHYLLGILLPLQVSFDTPSLAKYWSEINNLEFDKSTKNLILISFRDFVILPYFEVQQELNCLADIDILNKKNLIQCFGMMKSMHSVGYNQRVVDHLGSVLQQTLVTLKPIS